MTSFNSADSNEEDDDERPMELRETALRKETGFGPMTSNSDQEVLVGEGGCADCSALSATSACSNISQLITEEDLIDTLFHTCDRLKSGQVPVSSLLDYIKHTTQATDEQGNNSDLEDLWFQFDPNGVDVSVDINTCRSVMTQWVSQVRRQSGNEFCCNSLTQDLIEFSPAKVHPRDSEAAGGTSSSPVRKPSNLSANDCSTFESMEMHGKDSSMHNIELLAEISELEFQNKKLQSQLLECQSQIALVDDQNNQLTSERDDLKKKVASLHRVAETNRDLLKENLELKTLVSNLEEIHSAVKAEKCDLEKECESRTNALENDLSVVSAELERLKAEKESLVRTNKNQLKLWRKEKKESVKSREKIQQLQAQLQEYQRMLDESRRTEIRAGNGFLASPISGLLAKGFEGSQNAARRSSTEEENCSSIQDEIRNLIDDFGPGLQSPFCEKLSLGHFLKIDRRSRKFSTEPDADFARLPETSPTTDACSASTTEGVGKGTRTPPESLSPRISFRVSVVDLIRRTLVGNSVQDFSPGDLVVSDAKSVAQVDVDHADLLHLCRKGNLIQHLCVQLLIRNWRNQTRNTSGQAPSGTHASEDPKTRSLHLDAATQAVLPEAEALTDLPVYSCPESDAEDWSFLQPPQAEAELKESAEILNLLRSYLDKIEAVIRILLANLPAANAATVALQLGRSRQKPCRNPPFISQQASRDSNNMSFDSGVPVDLSPSSPECNSKLRKWLPKDGRPLKQISLPDAKSQSLDQSRGVGETRVIGGYRRALSCPVLQSRCSLIAEGIQTDVSCVRMAVDDERVFGAYRSPPDDAQDASETSAVVKLGSFIDHGPSGIDASNPNCPGHGSRKLPMLPEEDHEDVSSPSGAIGPRHTSHMLVNLRLAPPPYRPPPPPPPPSASTPRTDGRGGGASSVLPSDPPFPTSVFEIGPIAPTAGIASFHQRGSANGEREEKSPEHLLRKRSSKRRLGFEGSSTVIRRSAAVELDEFDSPVVDEGEEAAPNDAEPETPKPKTSSPSKSEEKATSEERPATPPTVETPKWSEVSLLAAWTNKRRKSSLQLDSLSELEIEDEFNRLSLANRLDKSTLGQRLDLHQRQRDLAEREIEKELVLLKSTLNDVQAKSQTFTDAEVRHSLTQIQQRVDVIRGAVARVSGRAEAYGVIQKEKKNCQDFALLIKYAEIEKNRCKQFEKQLEEVRQMNQRLSNENAIHRLTSSGGGGSSKSILLKNSPLRSRRRASVAMDCSPSLEAIAELCSCPKAANEAQGTARINAQCPVHSTKMKSGRRSSICASTRSGQERASTISPALFEVARFRFDAASGVQETNSASEQRVAADKGIEESSEENVDNATLDESNEDFGEEFNTAQSSDVYEHLDNSSEDPDEDDDDLPPLPARPSPAVGFCRRWRDAETWLTLRYLVGVFLVLSAAWTLLCSFFPSSWPYASGAPRVSCGLYSWEELLRPYLSLRHHSSPPV